MLTPHEPPVHREALSRTLVNARLFRGLDSEAVTVLAANASVRCLARREQLWARGTPADHVHVILRGVLELERAAAGGEPSLVALFGAGESPGVPMALTRQRYLADAYAATGALEVLRVRAEPLLEMMSRNVVLANSLNRALLDHCRLLHAKVDVLGAGTVPRRLATCLLDLADRFGDEQTDGTHAIPIPLSRQQLARCVCARVETVIRVMSRWQKVALVTTTKDGFEIPSVPALRRVLLVAPLGSTVVTTAVA